MHVRGAHLAGFALGLLGPVLVLGAALGLLGRDFDADGWGDTLAAGRLRAHIFWTGPGPEPLEATGRTPTESAHDVLRQALLRNDFVLEFLHRDDPEEVAFVRAAAERIVEGASSDRDKVERLLSWMRSNWDRSVEYSVVNAAELLRQSGGMCESSGFVVGVLDTLGIKARMVSSMLGPVTAVEVWLDGHWRVLILGSRSVDERSLLEINPGGEENAAIVFFWKDAHGRIRRGKLWYQEAVARVFRSDQGISAGAMPDLSRVRLTH
jgi:hypothetical protein